MTRPWKILYRYSDGGRTWRRSFGSEEAARQFAQGLRVEVLRVWNAHESTATAGAPAQED